MRRQRINVFVYGTLRDEQFMRGFGRGDAERIPGEWEVPGYALYGAGQMIPAARNDHVTTDRIVGDIFRVSLDTFHDLLRYEGWPGLYEYEEATAVASVESHLWPDGVPVVLFTAQNAGQFGPHIPNGDFLNPDYESPTTPEVPCASEMRR